MKKLLALVLAASMILAMVACGQTAKPAEAAPAVTEAPKAEEPVKEPAVTEAPKAAEEPVHKMSASARESNLMPFFILNSFLSVLPVLSFLPRFGASKRQTGT